MYFDNSPSNKPHHDSSRRDSGVSSEQTAQPCANLDEVSLSARIEHSAQLVPPQELSIAARCRNAVALFAEERAGSPGRLSEISESQDQAIIRVQRDLGVTDDERLFEIIERRVSQVLDRGLVRDAIAYELAEQGFHTRRLAKDAVREFQYFVHPDVQERVVHGAVIRLVLLIDSNSDRGRPSNVLKQMHTLGFNDSEEYRLMQHRWREFSESGFVELHYLVEKMLRDNRAATSPQASDKRPLDQSVAARLTVPRRLFRWAKQQIGGACQLERPTMYRASPAGLLTGSEYGLSERNFERLTSNSSTSGLDFFARKYASIFTYRQLEILARNSSLAPTTTEFLQRRIDRLTPFRTLIQENGKTSSAYNRTAQRLSALTELERRLEDPPPALDAALVVKQIQGLNQLDRDHFESSVEDLMQVVDRHTTSGDDFLKVVHAVTESGFFTGFNSLYRDREARLHVLQAMREASRFVVLSPDQITTLQHKIVQECAIELARGRYYLRSVRSIVHGTWGISDSMCSAAQVRKEAKKVRAALEGLEAERSESSQRVTGALEELERVWYTAGDEIPKLAHGD